MAITSIAEIFKSVKAKMVAPTDNLSGTIPVSYRIEVLSYQSTRTAGVGTSASSIAMVGHGLVGLDMIVNETRRTTGAERGGRLVSTVGVSADAIPMATTLTGQVSGDSIRLYKFENWSGILRPNTFKLTRRGLGQSALTFELVTHSGYLLKHGQYVRVVATKSGVSEYVFYGKITSHDETLVGSAQTTIIQVVNCQGLSVVAAQRSVDIYNAAGTTYGSIVQYMLDNYLYQDGVRFGTVDTGSTLADDWDSAVISIKEILDECASKSGFDWYIDDEAKLHFKEPSSVIVDAVEPIIGVDFNAIFDLKISTDATTYYNKIFVHGGVDEENNDILLGFEDYTEAIAQQNITAGTGAAGLINRDASLVESDYRTVGVGSTTTTIKAAAHGQKVGYLVWNQTRNQKQQVLTVPNADEFTVEGFSAMATPTPDTAESGTTATNLKLTAHTLVKYEMIYNVTRNAYRRVLEVVDADNVTVNTVSSQTTGDTINRAGDIIVFFDQANKILANLYKVQSIEPSKCTFKSGTAFEPMTRFILSKPYLGQVDAQYLIEDVEVYDLGVGLDRCWHKVSATKRVNATMLTKRKLNYTDYWREM